MGKKQFYELEAVIKDYSTKYAKKDEEDIAQPTATLEVIVDRSGYPDKVEISSSTDRNVTYICDRSDISRISESVRDDMYHIKSNSSFNYASNSFREEYVKLQSLMPDYYTRFDVKIYPVIFEPLTDTSKFDPECMVKFRGKIMSFQQVQDIVYSEKMEALESQTEDEE